ncbi:MAG: TRAP transporter small permease, partial [Acetobacteraceae bacterium]
MVQPGLGRSWPGLVEAKLGRVVELAAAALVATETMLLLTGILARYVFHNSLVWSDELASVLFLWLAMLGAVVAFRRGEHMRMTALVALAPAGLRHFLEALAVAAPIGFLLLLLHPAWDYMIEESFIVTPAMEIPGSWRAAALPVGLGLMLLVALARLFRTAGFGRALVAAALVGVVAGAFL